MNIITLRQTFEWDSVKNKENLRKHKIRFSEITSVFDDPFLIVYLTELIPRRCNQKEKEVYSKNVQTYLK